MPEEDEEDIETDFDDSDLTSAAVDPNEVKEVGPKMHLAIPPSATANFLLPKQIREEVKSAYQQLRSLCLDLKNREREKDLDRQQRQQRQHGQKRRRHSSGSSTATSASSSGRGTQSRDDRHHRIIYFLMNLGPIQ